MDSKASSKGNAALLKTTKVSEWTLHQGGYLSLLFGGFLLLGCALAYVIAVSRGNVEPFLPLISDAAGSPPQNGIFGTLICIGGMFGVMFMLLRYLIVLEKNTKQSRLVTAINKLGLLVGLVSMLGITLVAGYPANFYRNREVWLWDVGLPHMVGGVALFAAGLVYVALQCVLTLFLGTRSSALLGARVALCLAATAAFVCHMLTVPDNFSGVSHLFYMNDTQDVNTTGRFPYPATMGSDLKLPLDTGGSYVSSACSEWLLVLFFCGFFFTFFKEGQQYSLVVVVETHRTGEEHQELPENRKFSVVRRISVSPAIETAPAPEAKKYLRRDSTCQTVTEEDFTIVAKKSANGAGRKRQDVANGVRNKHVANGANKLDLKLDAKLDAKLNRLLGSMANGREEQKAEASPKVAGRQQSMATDCCDDLATNGVGHGMSTDGEDLTQDKKTNKQKNGINGQAELNAEAERIEVLAEESAKTGTVPPVEENGKIKKADSDRMMSSICPLSVS